MPAPEAHANGAANTPMPPLFGFAGPAQSLPVPASRIPRRKNLGRLPIWALASPMPVPVHARRCRTPDGAGHADVPLLTVVGGRVEAVLVCVLGDPVVLAGGPRSALMPLAVAGSGRWGRLPDALAAQALLVPPSRWPADDPGSAGCPASWPPTRFCIDGVRCDIPLPVGP